MLINAATFQPFTPQLHTGRGFGSKAPQLPPGIHLAGLRRPARARRASASAIDGWLRIDHDDGCSDARRIERDARRKSSARAAAVQAGVAGRASFQVADAAHDIPGRWDAISTFDVVHDAVDLHALVAGIRRSLADDGTYLMLERSTVPTTTTSPVHCHVGRRSCGLGPGKAYHRHFIGRVSILQYGVPVIQRARLGHLSGGCGRARARIRCAGPDGPGPRPLKDVTARVTA
jgi:hypothetical protein